MFGLGPKEIVMLAGIIVLLFGSKRIPELARGINEAIREIRNGFVGEEENLVDGKKLKVNKY